MFKGYVNWIEENQDDTDSKLGKMYAGVNCRLGVVGGVENLARIYIFSW